MAEHGGYRRPRNPAPVSGPGRLSQRTDGGPQQNLADLPNAKYGEASEFRELQAGAPMSASGGMPAPAAGGGGGMDLAAMLGGGGAAPPTPLGRPTERPLEPVTAGSPLGPGPGPSPEVLAPRANRVSDTLERLLGDDLTGEIADMYADLRRRGL